MGGEQITASRWDAVPAYSARSFALLNRFSTSMRRTRALLDRLDAEANTFAWRGALRRECREWRRLLDEADSLPTPAPAAGVRVRLLRLCGLMARAADDVEAFLDGAGSAALDAAFAKIHDAVGLIDAVNRSADRLRRDAEVEAARRARALFGGRS